MCDDNLQVGGLQMSEEVVWVGHHLMKLRSSCRGIQILLVGDVKRSSDYGVISANKKIVMDINVLKM